MSQFVPRKDHTDDLTNDRPPTLLEFFSEKNLNACNHTTLDELLDCEEKECRKGNELISSVVHRYIHSGFGKHNPLNEMEKWLLQNILTANVVSKISHILMIVTKMLTQYTSETKRRGKLRDLWDIDQFLDESISGKIDGTKNSIGFVLTNTLLQKISEWALNQPVNEGVGQLVKDEPKDPLMEKYEEVEGGSNAKKH
jgi:hypothetical protein